jgi:hypothetical protein
MIPSILVERVLQDVVLLPKMQKWEVGKVFSRHEPSAAQAKQISSRVPRPAKVNINHIFFRYTYQSKLFIAFLTLELEPWPQS